MASKAERFLPEFESFAEQRVVGKEGKALMNIRHSLMRPGIRVSRWLVMVLALFTTTGAIAQQPAGAGSGTTALPDSPQPKQQGAPSSSPATTSRFIGYVSNKSIVFPDIATSPGPLSVGKKFELFVDQGISPPYILAAGISSAFNQARDVPKSYGQGWDAYGGRYGESIARASSDSFFSTFLFASIFRQDPRFFPQNHPTLWGSVKYSAERLVVTRTDSGRNTFNSSGLLGPVATEALANDYLPRSEQTGAKTGERIGTDLAWRFAGNMFKDYWPTVFHSMGLRRLKVIPDPGSPDNPSGRPRN
jgi:hypothetical protein